MNPTALSVTPTPARPVAVTALVLAFACLAVTAGTAQAGNVQARASQNLLGLDQDVNGGASASAEFPPGAWASATRPVLSVRTDGPTGSTATTAFAAIAAASTNYLLWDLAADRALTQAEADAIDLAFNFTLSGHVSVDPISLSTAQMSYSAALFSTGFETSDGNSSTVFGPTGYLHLGDLWIGDVAIDFSLMHRSDADGLLNTSLISGAAYWGRSYGTLTLNSVTLEAGALPVGGLGVRVSETGEIWAVSSPVPEPATWLQLLAGLGAAGWLRRRRVAAPEVQAQA